MSKYDTIFLQCNGFDKRIIWCEDRINGDDIEFIRKDKYDELEEQKKEILDCLIEEAKCQCRETDGVSNIIADEIEKQTGKNIEEILN